MMKKFIHGLPKVELHIHIEGSLEPELMFSLAMRNGLSLPYDSVDKLRQAYEFSDLQSFLDIYYAGASVLLFEQDFYDMTWAYLERIHAQHVRHTELFFDPQTHTDRNVSFSTVVSGISRALENAETQLGISSRLIMCFLRHLSEEVAQLTLDEALLHKDKIHAVGLDSSELGNPPEKFVNVFTRALNEGFLTVAHAGEEGPPDYIYQAIELLQVSRIDHGVRCSENDELIALLKKRKIALTVCPLSNVKLCVVDELKNHNLKQLLNAGLCVTINSDDPAYFGGYMNENYLACEQALSLNKDEFTQLARNAIHASFAEEARKKTLLGELEAYIRGK